MLKALTSTKGILIQVFAALLALAAVFGYRCPAQGCPACRMIGH